MLSLILPNYQHFDITVAHVREAMNVSVIPDEIIVVNDGGDPSLKDMLKTLEKKTKIIYARIEQDITWNYNGACNLGVWLSQGDMLAFEDNDNIPSKDFYKEALDVMNLHPEVGRVIARKRMDFSIKDIEKPLEEWNILGKRGPNQGTYMMRRDVYLFLKGQDERFCGRYGWMYYDWRRRLLNQAKTQFAMTGYYYYVVEGQSNLSHHNDPQNAGIMRKNMRENVVQSPIGILNFTYKYEIL